MRDTHTQQVVFMKNRDLIIIGALAIGGVYLLSTNRAKVEAIVDSLMNPAQAGKDAATGAIDGVVEKVKEVITDVFKVPTLGGLPITNSLAPLAGLTDAAKALGSTHPYADAQLATGEINFNEYLQILHDVYGERLPFNAPAAAAPSYSPPTGTDSLITTAAGSTVVDVPLYATPAQAEVAREAIQNLQSVGGGSPPVQGISGLGALA